MKFEVRIIAARLTLLSLLLAAGALPAAEPQVAPAPQTRKMAKLLQEVAEKCDPQKNGFMNRERAAYMRRGLQNVANEVERMNWRGGLAIELLNSGETAAAIEHFRILGEEYRNNPKTTSPENLKLQRMFMAVSFFRLGEQENCIANHTTESCLFPIQEGGRYKLERGPRTAIPLLAAQLAEDPHDLTARWLLNISYMTLGEYPEKVPQQWLVDPKHFKSDYDIKRFPDIAGALGLDVNDLAGGSIADDFDGDGYLDLVVSSWDFKGQLRYFRNNANGTFTEQTEKAGLIGETGGLNLIQTDYNNDGFPDVLVLRGAWMSSEGKFPNSLLRNNGNGTFTDVTEEAGLLSFHPTQAAVWFDYNNDGWLDLFIGNESTPDETHPCELFRNNGDGTFTECARQMGMDYVGFVKGVASADYNKDGRPDLYLTTKGEPNRLFRNDGPAGTGKSSKGPWKFTEVGASAGVTGPEHSFTTWFWDYDQDGWDDILVCGYKLNNVGDVLADYLGRQHGSEKARLYRNNCDGTFKDVSKEAGLDKLLHGMGSNFGDLDNDGWLDCYIGTGDPNLWTIIPNRMFRNAGGKFFQDVTSSGGFGHLQKGHAVSFADFDNDGDQDIHQVVGGAFAGDLYRNTLYENPGHGNRWVTLKLEGTKSNRAALGARIRVVVETPAGERSLYRTVSSGGSFGALPHRQEIGLGDAKSIRSVEIFWPVTGETQKVTGVDLDKAYRIREGASKAEPLPLKRFRFATDKSKHDHHHHH